MAMMNRRSALRALAGAMAALPALLAAKPSAAPGTIVAAIDLDQIEAGTATALLDADLDEPREWVEIPGVYDVTLTLVDTSGPELLIVNHVERGATVLTGEIRLYNEDGG